MTHFLPRASLYLHNQVVPGRSDGSAAHSGQIRHGSGHRHDSATRNGRIAIASGANRLRTTSRQSGDHALGDGRETRGQSWAWSERRNDTARGAHVAVCAVFASRRVTAAVTSAPAVCGHRQSTSLGRRLVGLKFAATAETAPRQPATARYGVPRRHKEQRRA